MDEDFREHSVADIDAQVSADLPLEVERVLEVMEGLGFIDPTLNDKVVELLLTAGGFSWSSF